MSEVLPSRGLIWPSRSHGRGRDRGMGLPRPRLIARAWAPSVAATKAGASGEPVQLQAPHAGLALSSCDVDVCARARCRPSPPAAPATTDNDALRHAACPGANAAPPSLRHRSPWHHHATDHQPRSSDASDTFGGHVFAQSNSVGSSEQGTIMHNVRLNHPSAIRVLS